MNQRRYDQLCQGLTGVARKVLSAVPIQEQWSSGEIFGELARIGCVIDRRTIEGCLNSLTNSGLVCEPKRGKWQRVEVRRSEKNTEVHQEPSESESMPEPKKNINPVDTLSELAAKMRSMASGMSKLANEIEEATLVVAENAQVTERELQTVRQFKLLMKQIGE